jgi:methylmalonyl-CoA mutase
MPDQEHLFSEFPPTSKAEWLARVQKDLKGRPFSDLQWHLSESIRIDPFFHPDDRIKAAGPLGRTGARQNSWEVGEYISVKESLPSANQQALTALNGGAEALLFQLGAHEMAESDLQRLLEGIRLEMISVHFEFDSETELKNSLSALRQLSGWRGSAYATPPEGDANDRPAWLWKNDTLKENVRTLIADGRRYYRDAAHTTEELAQILHAIHPAFSRLAEKTSPDQANQQVKLLIAVDTSYFVSIAKIRALKILWANYLKALGGNPQQLPEIEAHLAPYPADSDPHTNMIRAATQALSAAIGGADRLFVAPADSRQGSSDEFTRRIARNVQHLLKMESYIDRVIDPAAGSYYIEQLTEVLMEEAWEKFSGLVNGELKIDN